MKTKKNNYSYENSAHIIGRVTLVLGLLFTFLPPVCIWLVFGIVPPFKNLLNGIISISAIMLPVSIVEILTFAPMLGSSAMYMSYLTGNLTNIRMPSAAIAMEAADVKPSTKEGDIIATIAIAGSIIASEIILVLGVLLLVPISRQLNSPLIQPAFQQILPALFGSIGAYYILKEWKLAVVPIAVAIILNMVTSLPTAITVPVCVAASVFAARLLYKRNLIKVDG